MADTMNRQSYLTTSIPSPFTLSFDNIHERMETPSPMPRAAVRPASFDDSTISYTLSPSTTEGFKRIDDNEPPPSSASTYTANETMSSSRPSFGILLCFAALTLSIFLVALDTVIIPTALPTISEDFHIPDSLFAWVGSAYLLINAASVPFWGKLSDVFGRKPIILIANSIFLGGSILCAVSISAPMLVGGRAVQGLGGGGVVVLVYVCVADMFSIRYGF